MTDQPPNVDPDATDDPAQAESAELAQAEAAAASAGTMADDALKQTAAAADRLADAALNDTPDGPVKLPEFRRDGSAGDATGIGLLNDVELRVKIELGRTVMYVEDVLRLHEASIIELDKAAGDPVDIYVNDRHIARGEVLVLNENFCVRINEIIASGPSDASPNASPGRATETAATAPSTNTADAATD